MNLPQWITVIAGSLTVLVWIYTAVALIWMNVADLSKDEPWWLRPVAAFCNRFCGTKDF